MCELRSQGVDVVHINAMLLPTPAQVLARLADEAAGAAGPVAAQISPLPMDASERAGAASSAASSKGVEASANRLVRELTRRCRAGRRTLLLVDEMDALLAASSSAASGSASAAWRRSSVVYRLLEAPHTAVAASGARAGCAVVGVANAVGLVDRHLPALPPRLRPSRVAFAPYDPSQLAAVLSARLERATRSSRLGMVASGLAARSRLAMPAALDAIRSAAGARRRKAAADPAPTAATATASPAGVVVVHPKALDLCARRVAAASGDLRRATAGLRAALAQSFVRAGGTPAMTQAASVTMDAVERWQSSRRAADVTARAAKRRADGDAPSEPAPKRGRADDTSAEVAFPQRSRADTTAAAGPLPTASSATSAAPTPPPAPRPLVSLADMARAMRSAGAASSVVEDVRALPAQAQALLVAAIRATARTGSAGGSGGSVSVVELRTRHAQLAKERLLARVAADDFVPLLERLQGAGLVAVSAAGGARGRGRGASAERRHVRVTTTRHDVMAALKGSALLACL